MSKLKNRVARDMVIMLAAGGLPEEVLEFNKLYGVTKTQVQQLSVPEEEEAARQQLIRLLSTNGNH